MLVGYLYCHELDELNRKFASGEISSKDLTREVRRHPSVLPTTARSVERIRACHGVSNKSAEVKRFRISFELGIFFNKFLVEKNVFNPSPFLLF